MIGEVIDAFGKVPEWNEQYEVALHRLKLDITVKSIALIILENIPSNIPKDFTVTIGEEMCQILQNWHQGIPDERFYSNDRPEQS